MEDLILGKRREIFLRINDLYGSVYVLVLMQGSGVVYFREIFLEVQFCGFFVKRYVYG